MGVQRVTYIIGIAELKVPPGLLCKTARPNKSQYVRLGGVSNYLLVQIIRSPTFYFLLLTFYFLKSEYRIADAKSFPAGLQ